jgi:hypothetical protein
MPCEELGADLEELAPSLVDLQAFEGCRRAFSLTRNYSQKILKEINRTLDQISGTVLRSSFAGTWADAARTFAKEMEASGNPEPDEEGRQPSLGWWLATRPFLIQLDIILAALKVLDAYTKWVADASGQEANSPLQNAIVQDTMNVVFTAVTFLILYFNEKSKAQ